MESLANLWGTLFGLKMSAEAENIRRLEAQKKPAKVLNFPPTCEDVSPVRNSRKK